jgi:hypothetical protein
MTNNKQQTAVEWYAKEHKKFREEPCKYVNSGGEEAILKQAKEMEKERMLECYLKADVFPRKYEFEKWYNETYGEANQ